MLEQAEDAEKDAKADLTAAEEQLKTLGVDKNHPSSIVNVYAPISGVIVAQNVTNAAAAGVGLSGSATAFTIADLSRVWIVCDVYENDIPKLQLGQQAKIVLDAYPDRPLTGRISDIGPILDPSLRTAKVRIEVANPGFLSWACLPRQPSPAGERDACTWFPPMLSFICMIAIGSSCPPAAISSGALRSVPGKCSPAIGRRFSPASSPASRSSPTHCYLKQRGTSKCFALSLISR